MKEIIEIVVIYRTLQIIRGGKVFPSTVLLPSMVWDISRHV